MPFGEHRFRCRDCGKWNTCGDCIQTYCYECSQKRQEAIEKKIEGRCHDCGSRLSQNGRCFDCEIFGKANKAIF